MKKLMIVLLTLAAIVVGVFFWKGGHHALFLADKLEDWLDDDASDQSVRLSVDGVTVEAETFWMELGDDTVYGLETGGYGVFLRDSVLYMDNGTAYTVPPILPDMGEVYRLLMGAVLHGRITRDDGAYHFRMDTEELKLSAEISEDLQRIALSGSEFSVELQRKPTQAHPIPKAVTDAMVRAQMERPMLLTEPLEVLLPAMKELLPLTADMKLGVECGILKLAEDVVLTVSDGQATLARQGIEIELSLPEGLSELSPAAMGLLLLRSGQFERTAEGAVFTVKLPAETTSALCAALVPQIGELGVTFGESQMVLTIVGNALTAVSMNAEGEVPFLITTIPVDFWADMAIR